ncbi:MAG: epoxyqueuosine reductase QueH, partial [Bacteroidales bacterium]|nr:epoxyqueuosine reductase QueH [Bacteroidales bacterium]
KYLDQVNEAGESVCAAVASSFSGSQPTEKSGCAGPLPLPSAAGPSLLRSRGWLRFPEAAAVSTTPATADSAAPASLSSVVFWSQNWRKGGLQPRRNEIVREQCFYNQNWCGCEFSKRQTL